MAADAGRDLRIKFGSIVVAGARTDSFSVNTETIDITDKDDAGVRTLLDDIATRSVSLSCSGVMVDGTALATAMTATAGGAAEPMTIEMGSIVSYTGDFIITSFEVTGEQADTITFSMSLESSGAITAS